MLTSKLKWDYTTGSRLLQLTLVWLGTCNHFLYHYPVHKPIDFWPAFFLFLSGISPACGSWTWKLFEYCEVPCWTSWYQYQYSKQWWGKYYCITRAIKNLFSLTLSLPNFDSSVVCEVLCVTTHHARIFHYRQLVYVKKRVHLHNYSDQSEIRTSSSTMQCSLLLARHICLNFQIGPQVGKK